MVVVHLAKNINTVSDQFDMKATLGQRIPVFLFLLSYIILFFGKINWNTPYNACTSYISDSESEI